MLVGEEGKRTTHEARNRENEKDRERNKQRSEWDERKSKQGAKS